jgi:hypothetical protein
LQGPDRAYEELPQYQPPTWLMTGVWVTDGSGFAAVPPRAEADIARPGVREEYPENELIAARGDADAGGERDAPERHVPDSGEVRARDTEQPKSRDPRLERYRER